tara:strand:+ start:73 stop:720 length:648 start_codon:yes stop_codon:yes gene_type:complete
VKISDNGDGMTNKIDEALKRQMKDEFVHGYVDENGVRQYPTIVALSKRHDVANVSLHRRSKSEDWQKEKNRVQTEYEDAITQDRMRKMITHGSNLDDRSINLALVMLGDAARRITEDQVNRLELKEILKKNDSPARNEELKDFFLVSKVLTPHEINTISSMVSNAQKIGKLALGQAQEISKVSANVTAPDSLREVIEQLEELATQKSSGARHTIQ